MRILIRVFAYSARYPLLALGTLFCAVTGTLMVAVFPAVTQRVIDLVLRQHHPEQLVPLIITGLAAFLAQDLLNALRILLNNHFEQRVIFDLRSDLYARIQKLPLTWFDNRSTGDIMTRLVEDVTNVERMLIDGIEQGSVALLQIGIVLGLMTRYSGKLTLAAVTPVPLLAAGALAYTLTAGKRYRATRVATSELNSLLHDNLDGIRQIKTYATEEREHARFNAASNRLRKATLVVMRYWALYNPSMTFLGNLGMVVILLAGSREVLSGHMDLSVLVAFLLLARYLYEPVGRLHSLNQLMQSGRAASERVFSILDAPLEEGWKPAPPGKPAPSQPLRGEVRYEGVGFAYKAESPVLQDVSLHAEPGTMIALVGPTGAGKTTLVNLLSRFYELTQGDILLDGRPIRSIPLTELRRSVAMVTQESFLFNGTTAENLLIGKPDATEEEMWRVLAAANAESFVRRLPEGLHTKLGERGVKLSVGEKQRLSIARALLKNPPILVLDEATASVDNTTERLIQEALEHLLEGRTSFVIAHRLSTVRHADTILVMERGRIIERGDHDSLIAENGLYASLCREAEAHNGFFVAQSVGTDTVIPTRRPAE
jgi:ABC-type multidrug transport system fused ATPase/permease subunit